jgi:AcrR family transcriptional regulator
MVETPWGDSGSLRQRRLSPGPGTSPEEVAKNQRERLYAAMVAAVSEQGYEATRVADLTEISGVSSRSFYDLFPNKEACFAAMLEEILGTTAMLLMNAGEGELDWEERVGRTFGTFVGLVTAQPAMARIVLGDAYAAGPAAREPLERAVQAFEKLSRTRLAESAERAAMPDAMIGALIGTLQEVARARLYGDDVSALTAIAPELVDLMSSYQPPPEPLRLATRIPTFGPESTDGHDDAERALRAFAIVVAERGYSGATIHEIARRGSMSPTTFYANFRDKHDALLAAIDSGMAQLLAAAQIAFSRGSDWGARVRAAIGSMLNFLASRPALASLLTVEVYAGGAEALRLRGRAAQPLGTILAEGRTAAPHAPPIAPEAIGAGIATLVRRCLLEDGPESLPGLAPVCTYIALYPYLGAEAACAAANGDGRRARDGDRTPPGEPPLDKRIQWTLLSLVAHQMATTTEILADTLGTPAEEIASYLRQLEEEGLIEEAEGEDDKPGEWVASKRYRLLDGDEWAAMSMVERDEAAADAVRQMSADIDAALATGTMNRRLDMHLSRLLMTVDEQGWLELVAIHRDALEASQAVRIESLKRLRETKAPVLHLTSIQGLFEMPSFDSETEPGVHLHPDDRVLSNDGT